MDILLTGIFIRVRLLNVPSVTSQFITIETSFLVIRIEITETSIYVVLNTANRRKSPEVHSSERTGTDFSAVKHQSHQPSSSI